MKELAELREDARPQKTDDDAKFTGVATHPLARRWLRRSVFAEIRAARKSEGAEREAHNVKIRELRAQLRKQEPGQ